MRRILLLLLSGLVALPLSATNVHAQDMKDKGDQPAGKSSLPMLDARLGGFVLSDGQAHLSYGGSLGFRPWRHGFARRLAIHAGFDYSRLSAVEIRNYPCEGFAWSDCAPGPDGDVVRAKVGTHWAALTTGLGVDLISRPAFVVDAKAGGALVFDAVTLGLWQDVDDWDDLTGTQRVGDVAGTIVSVLSGTPRNVDSDGYRDGCVLVQDACPMKVHPAPFIALGFRIRLTPYAASIGATYTRLSGRQQQIVATVGLGWP